MATPSQGNSPRLAGHLLLGCGVGFVLGAGAALVVGQAVLRSWAACEVGINNSANFFTVAILYLPPLTVLNTVLFGLVYAAVRHAWNWQGAFACALAVLVALTLVLASVLGPMTIPVGYPVSC